MPEDLKYIINQSQLTDIGAAIRSKLGEQDTYTVDEMPEKIGEISGGGGLNIAPILKLTLTEDSGEYTVPMCCIVDGEVMGDEVSISAGETADILILNEGSNFVYVVTEDSSNRYNVTDLINCTKLEDGEAIGLVITDPSQNASATLKVSGGIS